MQFSRVEQSPDEDVLREDEDKYDYPEDYPRGSIRDHIERMQQSITKRSFFGTSTFDNQTTQQKERFSFAREPEDAKEIVWPSRLSLKRGSAPDPTIENPPAPGVVLDFSSPVKEN